MDMKYIACVANEEPSRCACVDCQLWKKMPRALSVIRCGVQGPELRSVFA